MLLDDWAVFLRLRGRRLLAMWHRLNGRLMELRRRGRMRHDTLLRHSRWANHRRMQRCGRLMHCRLYDVRCRLNLWPHGGLMHWCGGLQQMCL